jgi:hypothetical protein
MNAPSPPLSLSAEPARLPVQFTNPWPGLAFYTEQDREFFFGRTRESAELLRLIEREALTVLFGRSGLGKTSLLRAGVIPQLRERGCFPVILRIDFTAAHTVEQVKALTLEATRLAGVSLENEPADGSGLGLWEFFHAVEFWSPRNDLLTPVLVFDQFEEVFTVGRTRHETAEFIQQLADLAENRMPKTVQDRLEQGHERIAFDPRLQNYKVVLSLREDFVSKLDSLRPILPAVMRNRFALNALDGERALGVVQGAGREIVTANVARQIVAAVAGGGEFQYQPAEFRPDAEIEPAYLSVMCHELFQRMGALGRSAITEDLVATEQGGILEGLYERSFLELHRNARLFVEDRLLTASGFRASVPLSEAVSEDVPAKDLDLLVDRRLLRFEDRLGTRHVELSHDLLTRIVQKSRDLRRTAEASELERREQADLHRKLVRSRIQAAFGAAAALFLLCTIVFYLFAWKLDYSSYYKSFTKRFGKPEGVDRLSKEAVAHRTASVKIIRHGFWGEVVAMEAVDNAFKLTANHSIGTYLRNSSDDTYNADKECQWKFVYNEQENIVYEIALDRSGRMVWGLVYSPGIGSGDKTTRTAKAMFVGPDGYPKPQLKSSAEYVEIEYDSRGYEVMRRFRDRNGTPMPGPDGAFARAIGYDATGRETLETSLDINGRPIEDEAGNASLRCEYDSDGNLVKATALDSSGKPTLLKARKVAMYEFAYDRWGNRTETRVFDADHRPSIDATQGSHLVRSTYDEHGHLVELGWLDPDGKPFINTAGFARETIETDEHGDIVREAFFGVDQRKPCPNVDGIAGWKADYDGGGHIVQILYLGIDGKLCLHKDGNAGWKAEYDGRGNVVRTVFFGVDGNRCLVKDGYAEVE